MISVCVPSSALVHSIWSFKKKKKLQASSITILSTLDGAKLLDDQCSEKRVVLLLCRVAVDVSFEGYSEVQY